MKNQESRNVYQMVTDRVIEQMQQGKALKNDNKAIVWAAARAEKAAKYIMVEQ